MLELLAESNVLQKMVTDHKHAGAIWVTFCKIAMSLRSMNKFKWEKDHNKQIIH